MELAGQSITFQVIYDRNIYNYDTIFGIDPGLKNIMSGVLIIFFF